MTVTLTMPMLLNSRSMKLFLDPSETNAKRALELIEKETALGASYLKEYAARIKSKATESDIDLSKSS